MGPQKCNSARGYAIIILYAFHTKRHIKSKFPNHIKSIYLSDIYELKTPPILFIWALCLQAIDMRALPENIAHSPNVGVMSGQRRRRWSNLKTGLDECLVVVVTTDVGLWRIKCLWVIAPCELVSESILCEHLEWAKGELWFFHSPYVDLRLWHCQK